MTNEITSKENATIKHAIKLLNSAKYREENHQFIIEGIRLCADAVDSNIKIEKVFYTTKCYTKFQIDIEQILAVSKQMYVVSENILKSISDTNTPQGIVCVCKFVDKKIHMDKIKECNKLVLLENIQNPTNLGAIFRTCDAFGVDLIVTTKNCCDIYNSKVLRGSMGSIFRLKTQEIDDAPDFIKFLNENNFETYATFVGKGAILISKVNFKSKIAVVFGNEGNGVTTETVNACKSKITIPMNKNTESLNVAVAAGIVIWEMAK